MVSEKRLNKYVQLREAIDKGNKDTARQIILSNAEIDINYRSSSNTLLHWAIIKFQDTEVIKLLLDKKADIHAKNHLRQSPLDLAVHLNRVNVVELLLNNGDYSRKDYKSLAYKAIANGNETIMKLLVNYGMRKYSSIDLKKCLDLAVRSGYSKIVEYVILHCKFNKLSDKWIPVDAVFEDDQQFKDCIDLLFKYGFTINPQCQEDNNFIYSAVKNGHTSVVKELLRMGVDPNLPVGEAGFPLLHTACQNRQFQIAEILIQYEAAINYVVILMPSEVKEPADEGKLEFGMAPLDFAVENLDVKLIKLLLENGADVDGCLTFESIAYEKRNYNHKYKEIIEMLVEFITDGSGTLCNGLNYLQYFAALTDDFQMSDYATMNKITTLLIEKGANVNALDPLQGTPLFTAIAKNNFEMVKVLLEQNADIQHRTHYNETPLYIAASMPDSRFVKILLDYNAQVNVASNDGRTPLYIAISHGHTRTAQVLLDHNAEINAAENDSHTSLHFATTVGNMETTRILLENKADVNVKSYDGWTSLHFAVYNGHMEIVKLLLDHNAEIDVAENDGHTPLHFAVRKGCAKVVQVLVDNYAKVNIANGYNQTPLHVATMSGNVEITRILLENKADANVKNHVGWTPLHFATYNGYVEIIQVLLDNDAEVNVTDNLGHTPLYVATTRGNVECTRILLKRKANVNARDQEGQTPLYFAASNGEAKIVKVLLDHNAEVNAANNSGQTPLHLVTIDRNMEITRILLENGADANVKNDYGWAPLHFAVFNEHEKTVQVLLDYNAEVNAANNSGQTPLACASIRGNVKITRMLLENGADVNVKDKRGHTSLHIAASQEHAKIVQVLLDHNAEINVVNNNGQTPFHFAGMEQNIEIIRILLENKADATVKDKECRTPLLYISKGTQEWIPNIIKLLLQFNVDVDYHDEDKSGRSPIYVAEFESKNYFTLKSFMEIEQLKMKKVGKSNITFYNLLKKNIHSVSRYANNEDMVKTLELKIYDEMFPLSIDIIRRRFTEAVTRNKLLKIAHKQSSLSIFHGLLHTCVDKVFSYLDIEELEGFIGAVRLSGNSTN